MSCAGLQSYFISLQFSAISVANLKTETVMDLYTNSHAYWYRLNFAALHCQHSLKFAEWFQKSLYKLWHKYNEAHNKSFRRPIITDALLTHALLPIEKDTSILSFISPSLSYHCYSLSTFSLQMVSLLLAKGANINAFDKKDCRALHWAAYMGEGTIL